jgi:uncharacterized membrane protein YedE/YeeE
VTQFTPISATVGGLLIGAAAAALLAFNGRPAAVSGILAGTIRPKAGEFVWRFLFVLGMVTAGLAMQWLRPESIEPTSRAPVVASIAGLLVGFGSQLGGGCTSGHGICGVSRLSIRSIVATCTFMVAGAATVFVALHVMRGAQ